MTDQQFKTFERIRNLIDDTENQNCIIDKVDATFLVATIEMGIMIDRYRNRSKD